MGYAAYRFVPRVTLNMSHSCKFSTMFQFLKKKTTISLVVAHAGFCSCFLLSHPPSPRPQDFSDVRTQSKEADSTLQMDWACSCSHRGWKTHSIHWQGRWPEVTSHLWCSHLLILFHCLLTELLHWYTQMLHSSWFASVVLRARRFFPAPRPSS